MVESVEDQNEDNDLTVSVQADLEKISNDLIEMWERGSEFQ